MKVAIVDQYHIFIAEPYCLLFQVSKIMCKAEKNKIKPGFQVFHQKGQDRDQIFTKPFMNLKHRKS